MDCEELRDALIDDPDGPPAATRIHIAECAACRELADETREGLAVARDSIRASADEDVPPVDLAALQREVEPPARARPPVLRVLARAAAVLLACVGVLALFGSRVEAAEGKVRVSFALPGTGDALPPDTPEDERLDDVLRALDPEDPDSALRVAMNRGLVPLAEWLDEREARDTERLDELVAYVRGVHRRELLALRGELDLMRAQLDASRSQFAALNRPPALPSAD